MNKIIIANLKMNFDALQTSKYLKELSQEEYVNKIVVFPSVSNLFLSTLYDKNENIEYGIQDFYFKDEGSYTGAVNLRMLEGMNVKYALVGHSERRKVFKDSNATINKKIIYALNNGVTPILCIGESLGQTRNNLYKSHLKRQISLALRGVKVDDINKIIIAYEPDYTVGEESGITIEHIEENIKLIKDAIQSKSVKTVLTPKILFGGNITTKTYKQFLDNEFVDGVLVGREALEVENIIKMGQDNE